MDAHFRFEPCVNPVAVIYLWVSTLVG